MYQLQVNGTSKALVFISRVFTDENVVDMTVSTCYAEKLIFALRSDGLICAFRQEECLKRNTLISSGSEKPVHLNLLLEFHFRTPCLQFLKGSISPFLKNYFRNNEVGYEHVLGWGDGGNSKTCIYAASIHGSFHGIQQISESLFQALLKLQEVMESHPSTRPLLGGNLSVFRNSNIMDPQSGIIDGEFVQQLLTLDKSHQKNIITHWEQELQKVMFSPMEIVTNITSILFKLGNM
jgi:hypothetical protein